MPRRKRNAGSTAENLFKMVLIGLIFISLTIGGVAHFMRVFVSLAAGLLAVAVVVGLVIIAVRLFSTKRNLIDQTVKLKEGTELITQRPRWTEKGIADKLSAIDWYQFEKINAAILAKEGWQVERKGGATPDGGVDLIAVKGEVKVLIQCKHWVVKKVQENVVREMLGSMTHFGVRSGSIHTLKGWTWPAARFAEEHQIALCDEHDLSKRARCSLTDNELDRWLLDETHHCPKCEAVMVRRTGDFKPFWGCSTYPRCHGVLRGC